MPLTLLGINNQEILRVVEFWQNLIYSVVVVVLSSDVLVEIVWIETQANFLPVWCFFDVANYGVHPIYGLCDR